VVGAAARRHRVGMDHEAACLLLTAPVLGRRTPLAIRADGFDWDALFEATASGPPAARVLVAAAYELWETRRAVALWELPASLDRDDMQRVIDALCISHGRPLKRRLERLAPSEHAAVRHVLTSRRLAKRVAPYVHPDGFDWYGLLAGARTMSRGQRLLVDVAHDLWTRGDEVGLREITRSLDRDGFVRVLEALAACREAFGRAPRPVPSLAHTA
jgi:hypothetical protein